MVILCVPLVMGMSYKDTLTETQNELHEVANQLRDIGIADDHYTIQSLSSYWLELEGIKTQISSFYTDNDAVMLAKVTFCEARGITNKNELAAVMWTILNRKDTGYDSIRAVIMAPNQFAYRSSAPMKTDQGIDLYLLAHDVLERWAAEKLGQTNVGRILPPDYKWYAGDGRHNYFRNAYRGGQRWDFSLPSPYYD